MPEDDSNPNALRPVGELRFGGNQTRPNSTRETVTVRPRLPAGVPLGLAFLYTAKMHGIARAIEATTAAIDAGERNNESQVRWVKSALSLERAWDDWDRLNDYIDNDRENFQNQLELDRMAREDALEEAKANLEINRLNRESRLAKARADAARQTSVAQEQQESATEQSIRKMREFMANRQAVREEAERLKKAFRDQGMSDDDIEDFENQVDEELNPDD